MLAVVGVLTEEQGNVIHQLQGSVEAIVGVMRMNSHVVTNRSALVGCWFTYGGDLF